MNSLEEHPRMKQLLFRSIIYLVILIVIIVFEAMIKTALY